MCSEAHTQRKLVPAYTYIAVESLIPSSNCPCTNTNQAAQATPPPAFVGTDYFCDTGSEERTRHQPICKVWFLGQVTVQL